MKATKVKSRNRTRVATDFQNRRNALIVELLESGEGPVDPFDLAMLKIAANGVSAGARRR